MSIRRLLSSLRVRLILLVLVAVLPAFGIILWTSFEERSDSRRQAERAAMQLTAAVAAQQNAVIDGAQQLFVGLSAAPQILAGDRVACAAYLASVNAVEKQYIAISLASPSGDILCSSVTLNGPVNISDREYVQRMLQTRQFTTGEYIIARGGLNVPTLPFAYPLNGQSGEVTGILVSGLDLTWLTSFVARIQLPKDTTLTVIDRNGIVLSRFPDPATWVGKTVLDKPLGRAVLAAGSRTAELPGLDGKQRLFAFAPFGASGQNDAYVAVGISADTAYAGINSTLARNLGLLGIVALLALVAAWFVGDWFVLRGVRALIATTRRLRDGDLVVRTGLAHDRGEIGELAGSFDDMAASLERRAAERKQAEEELAHRADELARSNAELEQFAYVASHDLQEPLRMVGNYTQLLARRYRGKLGPEADEFIAFAVDGATRMQTLINDLLTLSRVGTRGKDLQPTDAEEVFQQTLSDLRGALEESGGQVTHDNLPVVLADRVQLGQLLQNLIGNALKFHGSEPPRVHVSALREGDEWVFSIRDRGIGIAAQYADRIFVIFQRLHGREAYPGTGIGLAVCKKIVERHGGRIWVESTPGAGATFHFTLPTAECPGMPAAVRAA